jgi:hypothetical protein
MQRKERFPPEADTQPDVPQTKGAARQPRPQAPPVEKPRPTARPARPDEVRRSGVRVRRPARSTAPAATVDEVVADMTRDPRREREDD